MCAYVWINCSNSPGTGDVRFGEPLGATMGATIYTPRQVLVSPRLTPRMPAGREREEPVVWDSMCHSAMRHVSTEISGHLGAGRARLARGHKRDRLCAWLAQWLHPRGGGSKGPNAPRWVIWGPK